jgi:hypothetical protein
VSCRFLVWGSERLSCKAFPLKPCNRRSNPLLKRGGCSTPHDVVHSLEGGKMNVHSSELSLHDTSTLLSCEPLVLSVDGNRMVKLPVCHHAWGAHSSQSKDVIAEHCRRMSMWCRARPLCVQVT